MTLSKREQFIAILVGILFGGYLLNVAIIDPLLAAHASLNDQIAKERISIAEDKRLILHKPANIEKSTKLMENLKADQSEAQSQLSNYLVLWRNDARLNLDQISPASNAQPVLKVNGKPNEKEKSFLKIGFRLGGSGGMAQVGQFLWLIQTAGIPVRITDLSVSSKKEGTDDLEMNLGVSTLFLSPDGQKFLASQGRPNSSTRGAATRQGMNAGIPSSGNQNQSPMSMTPATPAATTPSTTSAAISVPSAVSIEASPAQPTDNAQPTRMRQALMEAAQRAATQPAGNTENRP